METMKLVPEPEAKAPRSVELLIDERLVPLKSFREILLGSEDGVSSIAVGTVMEVLIDDFERKMRMDLEE